MTFADFLEIFAWPLAALALASIGAPLVGAFLHVRGTSFHGVALPQVAACGVAFGFAQHGFAHGGHEPSRAFLLAWAAGAVAVTALGLAALSARRSGDGAAPVAATFALASGLTVLAGQLAPMGGLHVDALLSGETLSTGQADVLLLGVTVLAVIAAVALGWRVLTAAGHDPEFATAAGLPVRRWNLVLGGVSGALIVVGSLTVGALAMFALLVLPALAASGSAPSMAAFLRRAPALGFASAVCGALCAFRFDLPVGASVTVGAGAVLGTWRALMLLLPKGR